MLRIRTGYSFRQATGHLKDVNERLDEIGAEFAPITDTSSTFGWCKWDEIAGSNKKVVFGVEIGVTHSINAKKPSFDNWLFIARDDVGPINRLLTLATSQFKYRPLLTVEQALKATASVEVIMGHRPTFREGMWPNAVPGLSLSLSPASARPVVREALARNIPLAASGDNRYARPGDEAVYETLCGFNASTQTYPQHILSPSEWLSYGEQKGWGLDVLEAALARSRAILAGSSATLRRASLPAPFRSGTLRDICEIGAQEIGVDLNDPVYAERLDRELKLIAEKGYEDYFYIVSDLVKYARSVMAVGPARGSSCGSLVCYLLRITTVDPIPHGLIFERFIDINRDDMPDIDIDFSDQKREWVFDYLRQLYGSDHVARLGTVNMYMPRSALREAAGQLKIPYWKTDAVAQSLIERSSGDSRALLTLEDTLKSMPAGRKLLDEHPEAGIVTRFEGHPRHAGQHAAGVVVADRPITDYVAVDNRTNAAMCDKKDAEGYLNLLKIDCLGLTQLSIFEDACEMAGLRFDKLEELPLDDKDAFEVLNSQHFAGIFQFNGSAIQNVTKAVKVTEFNDIVALTALGRPGPLASGGTNEWVRRKNDNVVVTYPHPLFEPYLKDTLGIVIYQEQVMEIGRNIGDLDWSQVTALRKAMSKSLGAEFFNQFGDPWKAAAIRKGVAPDVADKVWDDLCAYGSWSFNKSHSVAYGLISYWACWLKAHHPFEFAAATLSHEHDPQKQLLLLREMKAEGFDYVPVDLQRSTLKWTAHNLGGSRKLVGPLTNIPNVGPAAASNIIQARSEKVPVRDSIQKKLVDIRTPIDSLYPVHDRVRELWPSRVVGGVEVKSEVSRIDQLMPQAQWRNGVVIWCVFGKINPRDENEAIKVAKRGGRMVVDDEHGTTYLNLIARDDTGEIFAQIKREDYEKLGAEIVARGRPNNSIYMLKGDIAGYGSRPENHFHSLRVKRVAYIGDMKLDDDPLVLEAEAAE